MTPGGRKLDYNMVSGETYYIGVYCPDGMYSRIMNNNDYSVTVTDSDTDDAKTQTAYIVLYDSEILQSSNTAETGKSRYLNEYGDEYNYSTEFFRNYLSMIGDKKVAFIISVRDIDFDRYTIDGVYDQFTWLTLPEITQNHINSVVNRSSQRTISIIKKIKQACNLDGYQMPDIYIGTPHTYHDVIASADLSSGQTFESAETNFLNKYINAVESIYDNVLSDSSISDNDITGLYYGRKEASPIYDSADKYNLNYRNMSQVSDFIHGKGKKLIWIPYAGDEDSWNNIGEIVNTGKSCYAPNNDIFDYAMIQPGLFYSNYTGSLDDIKNYNVNLSYGSNGYNFSKYKVKELYLSTLKNAMLNHGAIIGGKKKTNTDISFELEYDISLVTGREHGDRVFPKQKADNFNITYDYYKDLIYTYGKSYGIYPGGPNELDYTYDNITNQKSINGLYGNINRHNIVNHLSALSINSSNDPGNSKSYVEFYDLFLEDQICETRDFGGLLYYITRGVLHNNWTDINTKNYLGR